MPKEGDANEVASTIGTAKKLNNNSAYTRSGKGSPKTDLAVRGAP